MNERASAGSSRGSRGPAPPPPGAPRSVGEMVALARAFLERKGIEEARLEADLLVACALGVDRLGLRLRLEQPVQPAEVDAARALLVRRGRREPVAYITGRREFYARSFQVGPGVLVPRPESELLVDQAREAARAWEAPRVLDVGTGSGCLAITLALELRAARVTAVDLSARALEVARANAARLGAEVRFEQGDGLELARRLGPFELVVANPPYVDPALRASLAPEVAEHEPAEALFAPAGDPDFWARELVAASPAWLVPGGRLLVELGYDQGARVLDLARARALDSRLHRDLAGVERVLEVRAQPRG